MSGKLRANVNILIGKVNDRMFWICITGKEGLDDGEDEYYFIYHNTYRNKPDTYHIMKEVGEMPNKKRMISPEYESFTEAYDRMLRHANVDNYESSLSDNDEVVLKIQGGVL